MSIMDFQKLRLGLKNTIDWIKIYYLDLIVIGVVPVVLYLLFVFVPSSLKNIYVLHHADPHFYQFFTSNFFHSNFLHLSINIRDYLVVISLIYLFLSFSNRRDLFYRTFFVIVLVLPFFIRLVSFLIVRFSEISYGTVCGFSAVNSALIGSIPFAIGFFVKDKFELKDINAGNYVIGVFLFGFIATISHGLTYIAVFQNLFPFRIFLVNWGQIFFWFAAAVFFFILFMKYKVLDAKEKFSSIYIYFLLISSILFTYFTFYLFPRNLYMDGIYVDFISHWLGYIFGFVAVSIIHRIWFFKTS